MAARTLEDQVRALLSVAVVAPKLDGSPDPIAESVALFNQIVLNFLLSPRCVLYLAFLARNGLLQALTAEQQLLESLRADVSDTSNPSYRIRGEEVLASARVSLLQLEQLPVISTSSSQFDRFSNSVQTFLDQHLSDNVRGVTTALRRPAKEAVTDLLVSFSALKTAHDETVGRANLLLVGVDNFLSAPMAALLGTSVVSKARVDLEEILATVRAGGDASQARDFATRLIGSRAALRLVGTKTDPFATLLPAGMQAFVSSGTSLQLILDGQIQDPRDYLQIGDRIEVSGVSGRVIGLTDVAVLMDVPMSPGPVTATSALVVWYQAMQASFQVFFTSWRSSSYAKNVARLDRALAALQGAQTQAMRNDVLTELDTLSSSLDSMRTAVSAQDAMLPIGAGAAERSTVNNILDALAEKHFDRAADLLLMCDVQGLLELDSDTASYGGQLLSALSASVPALAFSGGD